MTLVTEVVPKVFTHLPNHHTLPNDCATVPDSKFRPEMNAASTAYQMLITALPISNFEHDSNRYSCYCSEYSCTASSFEFTSYIGSCLSSMIPNLMFPLMLRTIDLILSSINRAWGERGKSGNYCIHMIRWRNTRPIIRLFMSSPHATKSEHWHMALFATINAKSRTATIFSVVLRADY